MSILDNNISIIQKRWPLLFDVLSMVDPNQIEVSTEPNTLITNGLQLTTNYDRIDEAKLQASLIPIESKNAYVYGPALGDTIEQLLTRNQLHHLNVVILNKAIFIHSLNVIDQAVWLNDPRVKLFLATDLKEVQLPFCANPTELKLLKKNSHKH